MSLKTRLGLVAGASLAVVGLCLAAPTAASAQTCTPATAPGANPGPDTYDCLAGTFPAGITYNSDGNLTVNMVANGAVVDTTLATGGANLFATGSDTVTWNSTVGSVTGAAGTAGPVIDTSSVSGAINISTGTVTGTVAGVTHGVRARSTTGAITISTGGVSASNAAAGLNAIEAVTAGNIVINTTGGINGRQRSIFTDTSSGSGTTTINAGAGLTGGTGQVPAGGVEANTGTGALLINLAAGANFVKTSGGGVGVVNLNGGQIGGLDMNSSALVTVNMAAGTLLRGGQTSSFGTFDNLLAQGTASGPIVVNNNDGRIQGRFNWGAVTGDITINNNSGGSPTVDGWVTGGTTSFGSGDDLVENGALGVIAASPITTWEFGAGDDRLVNHGRFMTEIWSIWGDGNMVITGLETLENTGSIMLGSEFLDILHRGVTSDGRANDRLISHGTDFIGSGASRIFLDVKLVGIPQADCTATPAADCVDFSGGSTSGNTLLTILDENGLNYTGALNEGITVLLGVSSPDHFTLDPSSDFYGETAAGPVLQKQMVAYRLAYDEDTERLMFVGTLADEAVQAGAFVASAQETWRSSTGAWFNRQADLRATPEGLEDSSGAWVRIAGSVGERETTASYVHGGATVDYDLTHKHNISHLMMGADLLRTSSADSGIVAGGMIGFVRSDMQFDASPSEAVTTGFTGGFYASYVLGPVFVDGVLNVNLLHLTAHAPNMHLGVDVPLKQDIRSAGGQIEAGWRIDMGGGVFVEPLGGISYVGTELDDFEMPDDGGAILYEDRYVSLRAGAGLRLGWDADLLGMASSYSLTGRHWQEMEGENATAIFLTNGNTTTGFVDDVSGSFSEIAGAVSLYSEGGGVSGFFSLGGKFADDYRSVDGSVGVRLRW